MGEAETFGYGSLFTPGQSCLSDKLAQNKLVAQSKWLSTHLDDEYDDEVSEVESEDFGCGGSSGDDLTDEVSYAPLLPLSFLC